MVSLSTVENIKMPETLFTATATNYDAAPVILIVEDDEDSRTMLKILLKSWDYHVIEAENGEEAVRATEKNHPDLILMDVRLPYLDGIAATRRIRESATVGGVPVVFLSGCAEARDRNAAAIAGGNEFLVKPLDFDELENTLGKYIRRPNEILM